jgi:hypothetical protein
MRRKIRCDGWKRKYFGLAWKVNKATMKSFCEHGLIKSPLIEHGKYKHASIFLFFVFFFLLCSCLVLGDGIGYLCARDVCLEWPRIPKMKQMHEIFNHKELPHNQLLQKIKDESRMWITAGAKTSSNFDRLTCTERFSFTLHCIIFF